LYSVTGPKVVIVVRLRTVVPLVIAKQLGGGVKYVWYISKEAATTIAAMTIVRTANLFCI